MITIDAIFVTAIVGVLIPVFIGTITHLKASSSLKAILSIVLNAIQALIVSSVVANGSAIISKDTFILWITGLVISVATYSGVYKPTGIVAKLLPNIGLGKPSNYAPTELPSDTRADLPA